MRRMNYVMLACKIYNKSKNDISASCPIFQHKPVDVSACIFTNLQTNMLHVDKSSQCISLFQHCIFISQFFGVLSFAGFYPCSRLSLLHFATLQQKRMKIVMLCKIIFMSFAWLFFLRTLLGSIFGPAVFLCWLQPTSPHSIGPPPQLTRSNLCKSTEVCLIYSI